jgi:hypothetical protein
VKLSIVTTLMVLWAGLCSVGVDSSSHFTESARRRAKLMRRCAPARSALRSLVRGEGRGVSD